MALMNINPKDGGVQGGAKVGPPGLKMAEWEAHAVKFGLEYLSRHRGSR